MTVKQRISLLLIDFDKTCAIIGALASLCFIIFLLIYKSALGYLPIHLVVFSTLILFFCLYWLIFRKYNLLEYNPPGSKIRVKLWATCFFVLYILSILAVYFRPTLYERPHIYFILSILMAGVLACEVFTAERRHIIFILSQIILFGINLAASLELIVPSLIGGDPWYHYSITTKILSDSYIPGGYGYSTMPFFHLISATTSLITTLPYKFSTMISISFVQIAISAVFLFLIADYLFKNHRIGLLAALLVIIGDQNIIRSIAPIPNSFGFAYLLIPIYIIFTKYEYKNKNVSSIVIFLSLVPLIFIHSLPALIMTILLFVIWACFYILREVSMQKIQYITIFLPVGFFIAMLSWWYYIGTQVDAVTKIIAEALNLDVIAYSPIPDITAKVAVFNLYDIFLTNIGLYLFISISLIGVFYMISKRGNKFTFYFALISITPVIFYVAIYFLGGFVYDETFNTLSDRWVNLIQIVICVPLALSIYLIGTSKIRKPSLFFGIVVIIMSIFMILTPTGSPDCHILSSSKQYWSYYTDSEMSGNDFFGTRSMGDLYSDRNHAVSTSSSVFQHVYGIDTGKLHMLDFEIQSGFFSHDNSVKIFRTRRIIEFQRVGVFSPNIKPDLNTYMSKNGFSKIYQSPGMTGYLG